MNRIILEHRIQSVGRRSKNRILYESVSSGLLFAGVLLLVFFGVHFIARLNIESPWIFVLLGIAAGSVGGLAIGLLTPTDRMQSAREIDRYYGLKDRIVTASAISVRSEQSTMESLQIDDAVRHTETVEPHRIVPYRFFRNCTK